MLNDLAETNKPTIRYKSDHFLNNSFEETIIFYSSNDASTAITVTFFRFGKFAFGSFHLISKPKISTNFGNFGWRTQNGTVYHGSLQHKHWPPGPAHFLVRASTLYLSLARQDHRVKCWASRLKISLKITVARSMTNFATFSCILFLKFRYVCIA